MAGGRVTLSLLREIGYFLGKLWEGVPREIRSYLLQEGFPRFFISFLLTLLVVRLNSNALLSWAMGLTPTSAAPVIIVLFSFPLPVLAYLLEKILDPLLKKISEISIIKVTILIIKTVILVIKVAFEDSLNALFYLLGFFVGLLAIPSPNLRSLSIFGIILVLCVLFIGIFTKFSAKSIRTNGGSGAS